MRALTSCETRARLLLRERAARAPPARAVSTAEPSATAAAEAAHTPVLLRQVLEAFEGRQLQCFVDATLGAGGHASAILAAHPELRVFVGVDQDAAAHALAQPRCAAAAHAGTALRFVRSNFSALPAALAESPAPPPLSGALFDLGMSSMQVDTAARGFSFQRDGPLDMRMGGGATASAEELLASASEEELGRILREYGEERRWRPLARRLVQARFEGEPLRRTVQLAQLCAAVVGHAPRAAGGGRAIHPATRTFQALRIAVNGELAALQAALPACLAALEPGGRLAVISFHSLEDRIVKNAFRAAAGKAPPADGEVFRGRGAFSSARGAAAPPPPTVRLVTSKPLVADEAEARANARARSAKLRVCEKL